MDCLDRRLSRYGRSKLSQVLLVVVTMNLILGICGMVSTTRVAAFGLSPFARTAQRQKPPFRLVRTVAAASIGCSDSSPNAVPNNIAIVGGGLAGLSTAFHLLEQADKYCGNKGPLRITIFDKESSAGTGGASAVAGGLVHPLSPRGKLVHLGLEGLAATNYLIDQASLAAAGDDHCSTIVLRSDIFRLATSTKQSDQLQQTARSLSEICEWKETAELPLCLKEGDVFGGLRLFNGCKVLHLESYLKGLWLACQARQEHNIGIEVQWEQVDIVREANSLSRDFLSKYDSVVWAAGSGLFQFSEFSSWLLDSSLSDNMTSPVQLVRGQSVEVRLPGSYETSSRQPALLSGKYVSPLPDPRYVLVGATHEFQSDPLSHEEVKNELKERTESFSPWVWGEGAVVDRFTEGIRVQSQRGSKGRLPIIGKLAKSDSNINHWLFTGLSSRGLLYHGVYGKWLARAILEGSEQSLISQCPGFDWWRDEKFSFN